MLRIKIVNDRQRKQVTHQSGVLWLGRGPGHEHASIVIQDPSVSRRQLRVAEMLPSEVAIENLGRTSARLANGATLSPGDRATLTLPSQLIVGRTVVNLELLEATSKDLQFSAASPDDVETPDSQTSGVVERPLASCEVAAGHSASLADLGASPTPETLALWFETLLTVHRSAAGSDAFYDETASAVVELVGLDRGLVLMLSNGEWSPKAYCTRRGDEECSFSSTVLQQVVLQKRTFYELPAANLLTLSLRDIEAVVASPVLDQHNNVVGVVYGSRDVSLRGRVVQPLEAQFVQLLASAVGTGLLRLEQQRQLLQYENELEIGRRIQTGFLPVTIPHPEGWEIAARFSPAREVSGDFYDVFPLADDTKLVIAIADVCDKGVGAALFMALIRTLLRAFVTSQLNAASEKGPEYGFDSDGSRDGARDGERRGDDARTVVELVQQYVIANHHETSMFATLFFGVFDTLTAELIYVNAGHEPPLILGAGDIQQRLSATGPAIGMFADSQFASGRVTLKPGQTLFAFTDGVTEAQDLSGDFYGTPRLLELVRQAGDSASALLERVERNVREHLAAADQSDDITLLAVRRLRD